MVINYFVDKMVFGRLNLNKYRMPTGNVSVRTLYIKLQNGGFRD